MIKKAQTVHVAALQCALDDTEQHNLANLEALLREAAALGAQVICLPELFAGPYFCKNQEDKHFAMALPWQNHPLIDWAVQLAQELKLVIPVSFFERQGPHTFNSVMMIDADGSLLGIYRKSHIPDGPGYQEKYYFRSGDTGFRIFKSLYGRIGLGICWDQWFPECARALVLAGAQMLLYPTAIGSEPQQPLFDTQPLWLRALSGHAVCNMVPVVAANRIGCEDSQTFYGSSCVLSHTGEAISMLDRTVTGVAHGQLDLTEAELMRSAFGFFRDRREDLYGALLTRPLPML